MNKNKTVKEKVKRHITRYSTYENISIEETVDKIDKLYRKEITKEVVNMPIDLGRFGYGDSLVTVVTKTVRQIEEGLKKEKWVGEIKYHALPERRKVKSSFEENEIPPTLLDDDIADWEHDNLVKNG